MADKRMFSKKIIDSDEFLDMPLSTQALYFHLSMRADDDGFVDNPKKIQRTIGASDDDCRLLMMKKYILCFEGSGVIVITHWKLHNYIQKDRYKATIYQDEFSLLTEQENKLYTKCIQNVHKMDTQISIDKISLDKISLEEASACACEKEASPSCADSQCSDAAKDMPNIFTVYEDNIGALNATTCDVLKGWLKVFDEDVICLAIEESAKSNARSVRYVNAILSQWEKQNVKNRSDAESRIAMFAQTKAKDTASPKRRSKFANFSSDDNLTDFEKKMISARMDGDAK